jgi:hypothetical protein
MTEIERIEAQKNWRYRWLDQLFLLSHTEYQKLLWFERDTPNEIGWIGEEIYNYFDDLYLDDQYEYHIKEGNLTYQELFVIKDFHFKLDKFVKKNNQLGDQFEENEILNNPEWIEICSIGRNSWNELKKIISDLEELDHINGLEINYLR